MNEGGSCYDVDGSPSRATPQGDRTLLGGNLLEMPLGRVRCFHLLFLSLCGALARAAPRSLMALSDVVENKDVAALVGGGVTCS